MQQVRRDSEKTGVAGKPENQFTFGIAQFGALHLLDILTGDGCFLKRACTSGDVHNVGYLLYLNILSV